MSPTDLPKQWGGPRNHSITFARLKRTVRLGFKSLWLHRLRSLLTVLGIVFGVCSVISMLAVGEGASHEAQEQIRRLGSTNIILKSQKPPEAQKSTTQRSFVMQYGLTYSDIRAIKSTIPTVEIVVPARVIREFVWHLGHKSDADIVGTVTDYPVMRKHGVLRGRFFSDDELDHSVNVAVLGAELADTLFPVGDPVGSVVTVGSNPYKVIGIMNPGGPQADTSAGSANKSSAPTLNRMYIPLTTARDRFGETIMKRRTGSFEAERVELHEAIVKVKEEDDVVETSLIVKEILSQNHRQDDYDVIVPLELLRQAERTKQIFNIVLGAIAAISLIVGGIGIMNIMLASVTERTREIGIRRALGAKKRDIILQFLVETVILSGTGGLIGVVLGVTIPFLIEIFADMDTIVTFWSPAIAFSISGLVGIVFGIYPALRAAEMDPVDALRHE